MEIKSTIAALAALAQETRLAIFRYLVVAGPVGAPAGKIGALFKMPLSTLSFHLKELKIARLLESRRDGRSLIYAANFATINQLLGYLTEHCCAGSACAPAVSQPSRKGAAR
ncbi:MAG: transcriptional regulator [Alphaproteobacteria bacterium]|nr:transcriptional regulator [Alphaproteobacteria bacterium]